eukprot:213535_1
MDSVTHCHIEHVTLHYDDILFAEPDQITPLNMLSNLPNLDTLELIAKKVTMSGQNIMQTSYDWISSLRGFAITFLSRSLRYKSQEFMDNVYLSLGNKLESFHKGYCSNMTIAIDGKLKGIKEICLPLHHKNNESIKILIQQDMSNLERIYFRYVSLDECIITSVEIMKPKQQLMDKVMSTDCMVHYIGMDCRFETCMGHWVITHLLKSLKKDLKKIDLKYDSIMCHFVMTMMQGWMQIWKRW